MGICILRTMRLSEENLPQWKKALDDIMYVMGISKKHTDTRTDEQWLKKYMGHTPKEAAIEETNDWDNDEI